MGDLVATGASPRELRAAAQKNHVIKICHGLYVTRRPTAHELWAIVSTRWSRAALTGETAVQVFLGEELTFPLEIAVPSSMPRSMWWNVRRRKGAAVVDVNGLRVVCPAQVIEHLADDERAVQLLEHRYSGRNGKEFLDTELQDVPKLPHRTRRLLVQAAIGADSVPERTVARALKEKGFHVESNFIIGPYRWDIVLPKERIAVEIDGYEFHIDKKPFVRDRWKNNDAVLRGWLTLRYSGMCVTHHPSYVIEQIATARKPNLSSAWHSFVGRWHRLWNTITHFDPWDAPPVH